MILEVLAKQALGNAMSADTSPAYALVIGLFFYPVYTAALILFLDARSRGEDVHTRDVLAMAVRLWPTFAVLSAMSTLLIMFGLSLFVVPGIWVMIKLAFSEYLLVLRKLTPFMAMRESMQMTTGHFTRILVCPERLYSPVAARGRQPVPVSGTAKRSGFRDHRQHRQLPAAVHHHRDVPPVHADQRARAPRLKQRLTSGASIRYAQYRIPH